MRLSVIYWRWCCWLGRVASAGEEVLGVSSECGMYITAAGVGPAAVLVPARLAWHLQVGAVQALSVCCCCAPACGFGGQFTRHSNAWGGPDDVRVECSSHRPPCRWLWPCAPCISYGTSTARLARQTDLANPTKPPMAVCRRRGCCAPACAGPTSRTCACSNIISWARNTVTRVSRAQRARLLHAHWSQAREERFSLTLTLT